MHDENPVWIRKPHRIAPDGGDIEITFEADHGDYVFRMSRHNFFRGHLAAQRLFEDDQVEKPNNVRQIRSRRTREGDEGEGKD